VNLHLLLWRLAQAALIISLLSFCIRTLPSFRWTTLLMLILGVFLLLIQHLRRVWPQYRNVAPALRRDRDLAALWHILSFLQLAAALLLLLLPSLALTPSFPLMAIVLLCVLLGIVPEILRGLLIPRALVLLETSAHHERERAHTDILFREVRAERHDFLLHVGALQQLLADERWSEAKQYADQLVGTLQSTNEHIRGEASAVAACLLGHRRQAEQLGVRLTCHLEAPLSALPLSAVEQVRLLGNLLSNALEAAATTEPRSVHLTTAIKNGLYLLEATNSTPPLPPDLVDSLYQRFGLTTKSGSHQGLGTYIIHNIVTRHHGHLDFRYDGKTFKLKLKFPLLDSRKPT
jgi:LytT family two-component system sensor histidine kinase NatK